MNTYYVLLCVSIFKLFFGLAVSNRRKHTRLSGTKDEFYVPSLINFELKGKSLAWFPVKITGDNVETVESKLKKNYRKCRYIEEPNCSGTNKPKRIYNKQEDEDDPDAGKGENDLEPEDDYLGDDYNVDDQTSPSKKPIEEWTDSIDKAITFLDDITTKPPLLYSTEDSLTNETDLTLMISGPIVIFTSNKVPHTYRTDITIDISDKTKMDAPNNPTTQSLLVSHTKQDSTNDESMKATSISVLNTESAIIDQSAKNRKDESTTGSSSEITAEHSITEFISETSAIEITKESFTTKYNTDNVIQSTISDYIFTSSMIAPFRDHQNITYPIYIPYTETLLTVRSFQTEKHPINQKTESPINDNQTELNRNSEQTDKNIDDYAEDISDENTITEMHMNKHLMRDSTIHATRLHHIETPPYPGRPIDLHFPTCSGTDDSLDIKPPSFPPEDVYGGKKKEKCRTRKRKPTYHSTPVKTIHFKTKPVTNMAKKYRGYENQKKDAKVFVRIPPSLADLPVVVLKDPQTQMLSLSLISGEQDKIFQKNVYYQPPSYPQMFPPPFPYNNIYLHNFPVYNKMFPYGYGYGPNVLYNKVNYLNTLNEKHCGHINNLRWIRDIYYEDKAENSTKPKRNVSIKV